MYRTNWKNLIRSIVMNYHFKQIKNKLYIVIDEKDGVPIMQDPEDEDVKIVRFPAMELNGKEQNDESN